VTVRVAASMESTVAVIRLVPLMLAWPGAFIVSTFSVCAHAVGAMAIIVAIIVAMSSAVLCFIEFSIG
jgi:hypothetical protein